MRNILVTLFALPVLLYGQDSLNMTQVGGESYWGAALDVSVRDSVAYLATYESGLQIIDVSDPTRPTRIGSYDNHFYAWTLAVTAGYAYVVDLMTGVRIIDISDPHRPLEVTSIAIRAVDVAVADNYVFIAAHSDGLHIVDVSNPSQPEDVGFWTQSPYNASLVKLLGNFAYVVAEGFGFHIIDISVPSDPHTVGLFRDSGILDMCIQDDIAFVSETGGDLRIVSLSDLSNPSQIGFYDGPSSLGYSVKVHGDYAYLLDGRGDIDGMRVIDVSDPTLPTELGTYDDPGSAFSIELVGDLAFIADYSSGLRIVDISVHTSPVEIGFIDPPDFALAVSVDEHTVYIAHGGIYSVTQGGQTTLGMIHELQAIDISIPNQLVETGSRILGYCEPYGFNYSIAHSEEHAYITYKQCGLYIVDTSEPSDFVLDGYTGMEDSPREIVVRGQYAYLPTSEGLRVMDISNPASPSEVSYYQTSASTGGVFIKDSYAYLTEPTSGLNVLDISNLGAPTLAGYSQVPNAYEVVVIGHVACVNAESSGIVLIDVADPNSPFEIGRYDPPGFITTIATNGDYLAIASWSESGDLDSRMLRVLDISNPALPSEVGRHRLQGFPRGIVFHNSMIYVAETTYFSIYDVSAALTTPEHHNELSSEFSLHPIYPNPFNNTANIAFDLPREVTGRLVVYDVLGRMTITLFDGKLAAGSHSMQFYGNGLSSGTYFVRLETPAFSATRKATFLK